MWRALAVVVLLACCRRDAPAAPAPAALVSVEVAPRQASARSPVVVLVHGLGADEHDLLPLAQRFDPRLRVVSLRGPLVRQGGGYAWFTTTFTPSGPVHDAAQAETAGRQLAGFIRTLEQRPDVDPAKVFVVGFSQGAILGLQLALTEPGLVAGVVACSGRTLPELAARTNGTTLAHAPEVLVLHGRGDPLLPFANAETTAEVLRGAGVRFELQAFDAGHQFTPQMIDATAQWLAQRL